MEIGVACAAALTLDPLLEDAAGSMVLCPTKLLDSGVHGQQRQHGYPPQTTITRCSALGHPAIVGTGEGQLDVRSIRELAANEHCRVQDLLVDAQLVQVAQASVD